MIAYNQLSRFVTTSMLRRRFPHHLTSERTAQRHLANLVERGLLATVSTWATGPNFPHVYRATPRGLRFVKQAFGDQLQFEISAAEEKRSRGHGLHSLLHELFISELMLDLIGGVEQRDDLQLLEIERRYHHPNRQLRYRERGAAKTIEPDLGFLVAGRGENGSRKLLPRHRLFPDAGET
ncbi:MAG: hypothetical protein Tsb009_36780 [Planctomycetaceae bacterium]